MAHLFSKLNLTLLFLAVGAVYILGMFLDVMDVDAAQYASLTREMLETKSFLQIKCRFEDYLDKPPLTFWLASLSFWAFGISNFTYKLPSVLFSILAIYSTFRFAKIYYSREIAILSALILASTQAFFLINNDCRTDTVLIGCIAFTSWQMASYLLDNKWHSFVFTFVGIGLAMLSKGPLGLMVPVLGFGIDMLLKKEFKRIFDWKWLLGVGIVTIVLTPMCYGLYQQFGMKGLQFYFWDQSFGRITGSNTEWQNNPDPFFLLHSFAWSFLPWPLLFFVALFFKMKTLWSQKFSVFKNQEFITISAIIFSYLILSKSQYQLPHYIYGIFPFAAVLTASFVVEFVQIHKKWTSGFFISQTIVCICLWIVCGLLSFLCFQASSLSIFMFVFFIGLSIFIIFKKGYEALEKTILLSLGAAIGVNFLMNTHIYPSILKYQPTSKIAEYLNKNHVDNEHFFGFNKNCQFSLDFYTRSTVKEVNDLDFFKTLNSGENYICYTNKEGLARLKDGNIQFQLENTFPEFQVTKLTLPFLNPNTRAEKLNQIYLISINR